MQDVQAEAAELSDEQLCEILQNHLHIDAKPNFAAAAAAAAAAASQQKPAQVPFQASQIYRSSCPILAHIHCFSLKASQVAHVDNN